MRKLLLLGVHICPQFWACTDLLLLLHHIVEPSTPASASTLTFSPAPTSLSLRKDHWFAAPAEGEWMSFSGDDDQK